MLIVEKKFISQQESKDIMDIKKRNILLGLVCLVSIVACGCTYKTMPIGMPNPWSDCKDSYACAEKIAGFNMPLNLSNYTVRAMKGMVEVTYPLDENRTVSVRKTVEESNGGDNSGDYTKYPENSILILPNGVEVHVRKRGDKIYVMYFSAESGYYSARCEQGMSEKDVEGIYEVLAEVEASKVP